MRTDFLLALLVAGCGPSTQSQPSKTTPAPAPHDSSAAPAPHDSSAARPTTTRILPTTVASEDDPVPYLPNGCPPGVASPSRWTRLEPSTLSDDQFLALNWSPCTWNVSVSNDEIVAREYERERPAMPTGLPSPARMGPPRRVVHRRAGYLVGFNRGEWGGALLWYSADGKRTRTLVAENLVEIVPTSRALVALFGLAHLGGDHGKAVEIAETETGFHVGRSVDLGSAPCAAVRGTGDSIFIATHDGLVVLDEHLAVTNLVSSPWGMLYPATIALGVDDAVHVGMRGVIARVSKSEDGYREAWLAPVPITR